MTTTRPALGAGADGLVDYAKSLDCIHCGLCLRTCPTYGITGSEASSPRGRIHQMRAVAEGRLEADEEFAGEMDFCLVCRHCESACPAGVEFGAMMEFTRDQLMTRGKQPAHVRLARWAGFGVTLRRRWALGLASFGLRCAQTLRLTNLAGRLFGARGRALAALPKVPPLRERRPLPASIPAQGEQVAEAAMLTGCVMPEWLGRVNRSTANVLARTGTRVATAPAHVCCGALHAHNGDLEGARELARGTIEAFDKLTSAAGAPLPVVVNSAGCGAHMREYGRLLAEDPAWAARAEAFGARVRDFSEYLTEIVPPARLQDALAGGAQDLGRVAYDDPCHLCHGQQIRTPPRELLDAVPGLERVELDEPEACCGSAGIYSLLRPADSLAVFAGKLEDLERSGADTLVTANPGCQLQWESGLRSAASPVRVLHLAELLDR